MGLTRSRESIELGTRTPFGKRLTIITVAGFSKREAVTDRYWAGHVETATKEHEPCASTSVSGGLEESLEQSTVRLMAVIEKLRMPLHAQQKRMAG